MRKRTLVELGLLILLLTVGGAVLTARLRRGPEALPPSPTPTPRMHSLIRTLETPDRAALRQTGDGNRSSSSPPDSEIDTPNNGVLVVRVLEADGTPPGANVELLSPEGFRRLAPHGRLALEAPEGDITLYARSLETPPRQSGPATARIEANAYTSLDLVLPEPPPRFRDAGLALVREETFAAIADVADDGPAALSGLRPGDVLLEINGVSVAALEDEQLAAALIGVEGDVLRLRVVIRNETGELEEHLLDLEL